MQTIPDTGGGLSGFIASLIWHVYRFFPSSSRWDWLLLFFALTLLGCALFWPYLWKTVSADMQLLAKGEHDGSNQELVLFLWGQVWLWILVWFFYTDAGQTLLSGRRWFDSGAPSEVSRILFWFSLVINFLVMVGLISLGVRLDDRSQRLANGTTRPFAERSILNLYCGGGAFFFLADDGTKENWPVGIVIALFPLINFILHICYWYWSAASILLMDTMLCTILLNELVRMTFVYILHKRTFG